MSGIKTIMLQTGLHQNVLNVLISDVSKKRILTLHLLIGTQGLCFSFAAQVLNFVETHMNHQDCNHNNDEERVFSQMLY